MKRSFKLAIVTLLLAAAAVAQTTTAPAPGPAKPFKVPTRHQFMLPNGLTANLIPYGTIPKAQISIIVRAGDLNASADQIWLPELTTDLLREGTASKTAEQVDAAFARMGGRLFVNAGDDTTTISADVLSDHAAEAAKLLAEVAMSPRLPESELARLKNDRLRNLAIARTQPGTLAAERFASVLYGDHPYGRSFPTEAMLKGFTIDDVRKFYADNFGAQRTRVYVAGKFDTTAVEQAIRTSFASWAKGPEPVINVPKSNATRRLELVEKPNAVQSTLNIGLPTADPSQKDYIPLLVTNTLLGGSFISRITQNIRENKGYTYSPFSRIGTHYREANWAEIADVTTAVTGPSLKEIFGEIEGLRKAPPSADELQRIQRYMSGVFVLNNSSRGGIIGQMAFVDFHGLGDDYLRTYVQKVNAVTPEEVHRIAEQYLDPAKMLIVVVGDKEKIAEQIAPYGKAD